jgi:hypothetical protein
LDLEEQKMRASKNSSARLVVLPAFCLLLVGSSAIWAATDEALDPENLPPEMTLSLEELLADPAGVEDEHSVRCLRSRGTLHMDILDARHLLVRGIGKRVWLNRLRGRCLGMRPRMVLVTESRGMGACEFDQVWAMSRGGIGIPTGRCMLGKFEPITPQQADMLKLAFKRHNRDGGKRNKRRRKDRNKDKSEGDSEVEVPTDAPGTP